MPHRSFFAPQDPNTEPEAVDLIIDQPAAVAEHFDFALGVQAALTVCLIEAGLEVVPALETDPDPLGVPQLLYAEQPRARTEVWAEIDERRLAPAQLVQLQVYVTGRGVGFDARVGPRERNRKLARRILVEPGESGVDELIDGAVGEILDHLGASTTDAPSILELVGADDAECLAMMLPTLGASIRFDLGEGATPVHRELARASRGYAAHDASVDALRRMLH